MTGEGTAAHTRDAETPYVAHRGVSLSTYSCVRGCLLDMAGAHVNRSTDRSAQVNFRMSHEAREDLRRQAREQGFQTLQAYFEHKLLGIEAPVPLPSGRPRKHQQELPLTG